jgi:hypothetical protein
MSKQKNQGLMLFIVLILVVSGCERDNGFDAGGPITRHLKGRWKLDRIVTPSQTKIASQIGYTEIIESGNNSVEDYDKVFRDDLLVATHIWTRNPAPITNAKNMTITLNYFDRSKRFITITGADLSTYQASAYLPEIGSKQDTVKYYYSRLP